MSQLEAPFSILRSIDFCKVGDKDFLSWVAASLPSLRLSSLISFFMDSCFKSVYGYSKHCVVIKCERLGDFQGVAILCLCKSSRVNQV